MILNIEWWFWCLYLGSCPSHLRNDVKRLFFLITAFLMHKNVGFMKVIFICICTAMTTPISTSQPSMISESWGKKHGQIMVGVLRFAFWKRQTMSSQRAALHGNDKKTKKVQQESYKNTRFASLHLVFNVSLAWNSILDILQSCLVYFYSITQPSNPRYRHQNHHSRFDRTEVMRI